MTSDVAGAANGACDFDGIAPHFTRHGVSGRPGDFTRPEQRRHPRVLPAIASIGRLVLDVDSSINRKVTAHLKDVPWELALDVVLKSSGLASSVNEPVLRIAMADPALSEDRVLMGTLTVAGRITAFNLQNPSSLIQVNAPNADGAMQTWPVAWESADYLKEIGITPNTSKAGDQVIVTENITRTNTIRVISLQRPSDSFSWGSLTASARRPLMA